MHNMLFMISFCPCLLHTLGEHPHQLNIGAVTHVQSNGVVDEAEDWETMEAEDHLNSNVPVAGTPGI